MTARHPRTASRQSHEGPKIWKEAFWPAEWLSLRMSPVYRGVGIPHGDGGPVVVVPGFLCSDAVMGEMYGWLGRIGYRPYLSRIGLNVDCPTESGHRLADTVERAYRATGRRVRIVGHSLGGVVARKAALETPEHVSQLIYMGSPIRGVHAHPAIVATANALISVRSITGVHKPTPTCGCRMTVDKTPLPEYIHRAAIYTRADGVVDWHDARKRDPRRNHEVGGTHIGLVYNPRAYQVLGELLAEAEAPVV